MKSSSSFLSAIFTVVAPYAGAWVEISPSSRRRPYPLVAPYAGAWVEICRCKCETRRRPSLPTRERGLKYGRSEQPVHVADVAPYAGAWVEIMLPQLLQMGIQVAPYAGAWIEIHFSIIASQMASSLPTRERGLK